MFIFDYICLYLTNQYRHAGNYAPYGAYIALINKYVGLLYPVVCHKSPLRGVALHTSYLAPYRAMAMRNKILVALHHLFDLYALEE